MPAAPETVVTYMRHLADQGHAVSTIERAVAALCTGHTRAGFSSCWKHPLVEDMRGALRRELGMRPKKKRKADDEVLRRLVAVLPASLLGVRDRALLTLGWTGALRRSELVALDVADVTRAPKGLEILVRESKTDQERRGEEIPIFYSNDSALCPIRSLDAWLEKSGIKSGPILRALGRDERLGSSPLAAATVADRVKHYAKLAGLNAHEFAAHSLRRGFISTAARRGRDLDSIMVTSRHRSVSTLREYIERETLFERGAGEGLL
jgi:integrase